MSPLLLSTILGLTVIVGIALGFAIGTRRVRTRPVSAPDVTAALPPDDLPALGPGPTELDALDADPSRPRIAEPPAASDPVPAAQDAPVGLGPGGLPTRAAIVAALEGLVADAAHGGEQVAYVAIDIVDLDKVNRMFSYDVGDAALEEIVARFGSVLRDDDQLFHYSGDEFVVLRPGVVDVSDVDELAVAILEVLAVDLPIDGYGIRVCANLGVALIGKGRLEAADARRAAESALYRSSLQGRHRYEIFSHSARREVSPAFITEWLHESIANRHLGVHFQQIEDLHSRQIIGAEALMRWNHPELGDLEPRDMLPALRDTGLIVELGEYVIDDVCRHLAEWATKLGAPAVPIVFVNIDPLQLAHSTFLTSVEGSLAKHGVAAEQVCFELGQLSSIPALSTAWNVLREAKALGIALALDNFGGPETNIALLRSLQLSYLKLDRGIIGARHATALDDAFAHGIIAMTKDLDCTVIAEGIEDVASLDRARNMGCRLGQGFELGPPIPGSVLTELLMEQSRPSV